MLYNKSHFYRLLQKVEDQKYVFWNSLIFYFFLFLANPGNKTIAVLVTLLLPLFYNLKLKNLKFAVFLAFFFSTVMNVGKAYSFEIFSPGVFNKYLFPDGIVRTYIFSTSHILAAMMIVLLFRDAVNAKLKKIHFKTFDLFIFAYLIWTWASSLLASQWIELSILTNVFSLVLISIYVYIRVYVKNFSNLLLILVSLFSAQIAFETILATRQFISGSPLYKNIEIAKGIDSDQFGLSSDELGMGFRPMGTFNHANELGMWLAFHLSILLPFVITRPKNYFVLSFLLGLSGLALTSGRSAWLGFGISVLLILYILEKHRKIKIELFGLINKFYLFIFGLLLMFFMYPRLINSLDTFSSGTGYFRLEQMDETLDLIYSNPVLGVGSGMFLIESINRSPNGYISKTGLEVHNWYLLTAAENGLPLLIIFICLVYFGIMKPFTGKTSNNVTNFDLNLFKIGALGATISVLLVGVFQPFIALASMVAIFAIISELHDENY